MPNVLVHYAVQGSATRGLVEDVDPGWILLACIVPDIPWILQRVLWVAAPTLDPYQIRLHAIVQSSLFVSLFLCVAIAILARRTWLIVTVLSVNAGLHLLLDGLQIKWANGIHLFAPFSWELLNFGLLWPEHSLIYALTGLGLLYVLWEWGTRNRRERVSLLLSRFRLLAAGTCFVAYLGLPFLLGDGPLESDNHYLDTLLAREERPGREIEFDRATYLRRPGDDIVVTFAGERLGVQGLRASESGTVSIRGHFVSEKTVYVEQLHEHGESFREWASMVGLAFLALFGFLYWRDALPRR